MSLTATMLYPVASSSSFAFQSAFSSKNQYQGGMHTRPTLNPRRKGLSRSPTVSDFHECFEQDSFHDAPIAPRPPSAQNGPLKRSHDSSACMDTGPTRKRQCLDMQAGPTMTMTLVSSTPPRRSVPPSPLRYCLRGCMDVDTQSIPNAMPTKGLGLLGVAKATMTYHNLPSSKRKAPTPKHREQSLLPSVPPHQAPSCLRHSAISTDVEGDVIMDEEGAN
ncbi:hypothetical protein DL96DRAFT_1599699 [Flagelloscypha sp. PMI_526]|nr:hypothetical protein DL96DRAFT_1599699 [Flagelloscypha sp. PMI_526]